MLTASTRAGSTLALALAVLAPLACRSAAVEEPPRAATIEPIAPAPATPATPEAPPTGEVAIADPPPDAAADKPVPMKRRHPGNDVPRPPAPPELGAPCPAPAATAAGRAAPFDPCGTKGRVSVRWNSFSASLGRVAPCTMVPVGKDAKAQKPTFSGDLRSACIKDGQLWASSACLTCRMPDAGWSATALIAELTREQALACQKRLGLPADQPLLTAKAWAKALAAGS